MKVSVIIPTYNRAKLVKRAILSVLNQTYKDFELVVVDDGSFDNTKDVLRSINDLRLKTIFLDKNMGVSAARNIGINESTGEVIALLDSDDEWLEKKLETHLAFHIQGQFIISQTEEVWIRKGKRVNPKNIHRKKAGWIFEPSLKLCLVSPSCVMFNRELIRQVGLFDENLAACEDYDMWLRVSLRYPVGLCPYPLVVRYGGRVDQLSSKIIGLDLYRIYSLIKILRNETLDDDQLKATKNMLKIKSRRYIMGCMKRGKIEEALRVKELIEDFVL